MNGLAVLKSWKKRSARALPAPVPPPSPSVLSPTAEFRQAVADVTPLPALNRVEPVLARPRPIPRQRQQDEAQVLRDLLSDHLPWHEGLENGEELTFIRAGLRKDTLRRLRRGHWYLQAELDLHGHTTTQAREALVCFLHHCRQQGYRCVRIIHGKGLGSKNREPVLKKKVYHWLIQREEILAFCQARATDGGSGAMVVLLQGL